MPPNPGGHRPPHHTVEVSHPTPTQYLRELSAEDLAAFDRIMVALCGAMGLHPAELATLRYGGFPGSISYENVSALVCDGLDVTPDADIPVALELLDTALEKALPEPVAHWLLKRHRVLAVPMETRYLGALDLLTPGEPLSGIQFLGGVLSEWFPLAPGLKFPAKWAELLATNPLTGEAAPLRSLAPVKGGAR